MFSTSFKSAPLLIVTVSQSFRFALIYLSSTFTTAPYQDYTVAYYPDMPSKFGELLLRMPELQRVCQVLIHAHLLLLLFCLLYLPPPIYDAQVGKEMLCLSQQPREEEGDTPGFNFLMELLRGDH